MARRSQHTLQIMEHSTHFDLKSSVQRWRDELATQPGLTPESRRELETHLLDTVKEFSARGINDEESFWLARRRIGQPFQLGEEFAKTNSWPVWKRWVLWIATAMLMVRIFQGLCEGVSGLLGFIELHSGNMNRTAVLFWWVDGLRDGLADLGIDEGIGAVAVICGTVLVGRCSSRVSFKLWQLFFQSRARFLMIGLAAVLVAHALERCGALINDNLSWEEYRRWIDLGTKVNPNARLAFPLALVVLITWLIPSSRQMKPSPESSPKVA